MASAFAVRVSVAALDDDALDHLADDLLAALATTGTRRPRVG